MHVVLSIGGIKELKVRLIMIKAKGSKTLDCMNRRNQKDRQTQPMHIAPYAKNTSYTQKITRVPSLPLREICSRNEYPNIGRINQKLQTQMEEILLLAWIS
jgi:hypothetical protein